MTKVHVQIIIMHEKTASYIEEVGYNMCPPTTMTLC